MVQLRGQVKSIHAGEEAHFHRMFPALRSALEADLIHVRQHTRLTQRAREWEASERGEALLLDADELQNAVDWLFA